MVLIQHIENKLHRVFSIRYCDSNQPGDCLSDFGLRWKHNIESMILETHAVYQQSDVRTQKLVQLDRASRIRDDAIGCHVIPHFKSSASFALQSVKASSL